MSHWEGLNRRQFPRASYPCLVVLGSADSKKRESFLCHTENLGAGGICVTLKKNIKIFSSVEIELDLLDLNDHLKCNGKVVWNVRRKGTIKNKPLFYDIGIEFQKLSSKDQKRLDSVIQGLSKKKSKS